MSISSANIANLLKKIYPESQAMRALYGDSPLFGLIEKKMTTGSDGGTQISVVYGEYAGRSADFSEAQTSGASGYIPSEAFNLTIPENHASAFIGQRQIMATKNNSQALVDILKEVTMSAVRSLKNDMAFDMFSDGTGIIGNVSSVSSQVLTLDSRKGLRKVDIGSRLTCYTDSTLGTAVTTAVVSAIDRQLGKVTLVGTISGWNAGYPVVVTGDANAKIKGLAAWIPSTAPTSGDNFFGVDRSKDPLRLAGMRFDGTGKMLKDVLIDADAELVEVSDATPSIIVVSPSKFAELAKETSDRSTLYAMNGSVKLGYSAISFAGSRGMLNFLVDSNCPNDRMYMLDVSTWKFLCLGKKNLFKTW